MIKSILLLFAVFYLCSATRRGLVTQEAPKGFDLLPSHKRSITNNGEIRVTVGLKQRNLDKLEDVFWAVSDPQNPAYGRHMTFSNVIDLIAPSEESISSVINWMTENGVEREKIVLHQSKDFINIDMTVAQAESVFNAPQTAYVHKKSGKVAVRMESGYEVPELISALIDFVSDMHEVKNAPRVLDPIPTSQRSSVRGLEPRATSNKPQIISQYTVSGGFLFNGLFIYCMDGSIPSISSKTPVCGSNTLQYISATVTNTVTSSTILSSNLNFACQLCSQDDTCSETNNDQKAVLCQTSVIRGLKNYVPFTVTIASKWSDGSTSDSTTTDTFTSGETVTPAIISRTYNIPAGTQVTQSSNSQAVAEFSENFLPSDATAYFQYFGLPDMTNMISVFNSKYVNTNDAGAGEGILDIVAIMGTARNCKTYYWGESNNVNNPFLLWIQDVLNQKNPPYVHSVSYTVAEIFSLSNPEINARTNIEFIKAGTRGLTIVVASGDNGVKSSSNPSLPNFWPDFPASSPYVTSVGATQLAPASTAASCYDSNGNYTCAISEVVCTPQFGSLISSGGGFSNLFDIPPYQKDVVSTYLNSLTSAQKQNFNNSGRGYPDISALGHNVQIVYDGELNEEDGTSASAPFVAGMITLLNDIRISQGKPVLGFINPLLYTNFDSSFYNDVVVGSNDCVPDKCTNNGFAASSGWDPVTGLGTPIFSKMSAYITNLGTYSPTLSSASASSSSDASSSMHASSLLFVVVAAVVVVVGVMSL